MVVSCVRRFQRDSTILLFLCVISCTGPTWSTETSVKAKENSFSNLSSVFQAESEDVPFFKTIGEDQERQLELCKEEHDCRNAHFLRGVTALYENRELAALHFRKIVTSSPNSVLAGESRFWLWFLDVLNTSNRAGLSPEAIIKRLVREVVRKDLSIHELSGKLENSSIDSLKSQLAEKNEVIKKVNQALEKLSKQVELAKKEQANHQDVQQALQVSEKKVKELTDQLEALRRIDQEIKEKVPPTRPSEKMTPSPEVEQASDSNEGVLPTKEP